MRAGARFFGIFVVVALVVVGAGSGLCAAARPAFCIQGTMASEERPVAIVNGKVVAVGDEVDGATVTAISDTSVTFDYKGESVLVLLGEECGRVSGGPSARSGRVSKPWTAQTQARGSGSQEAGAALAVAVSSAVMIVMLFVVLVVYVFGAWCLQKIAEKTGKVENKWWAWIPILNLILMVQIAGKEWWWVLLMLIPYVNIVIFVIIWMGICEARGKSPWLGLLVLVPAANLFLMAYLAFSSDEGTSAPPPGAAEAPAQPAQPAPPEAPAPPRRPPASAPPPYNP